MCVCMCVHVCVYVCVHGCEYEILLARIIVIICMFAIPTVIQR